MPNNHYISDLAYTDVNDPVIAGLRAIETGEGKPGNAQYGVTTVNSYGTNYGAYQMKVAALTAAGEITNPNNVNDPTDWTGDAGTSLQDFLSVQNGKSYEDRAAINYMNKGILDGSGGVNTWSFNPTGISLTFTDPQGSNHTLTTTRSGIMLAAWEGPGYIRWMLTNGTQGSDPNNISGLYDQQVIRLETGALLDGQPLNFTPDQKAVDLVTGINDWETARTNSVIHDPTNQIHGSIDTAGQSFRTSVTIDAGMSYIFSLATAPNGNNTLPSGGLGVSGSTTLTQNGVATTSQIHPSVTTTYNLFVNSTRTGTGSFTLTASPVDDFSELTNTTGKITVGSSATGHIDNRSDKDWFAVSLAVGHNYRFDVSGANTNGGTLPVAHVKLAGMDGSGSTSGTASGTQDANNKTGVIQTAGTYYLEASTSSGTGTYTASVTDITATPSAVSSSESDNTDTLQSQALARHDTIMPTFTEMQHDLILHTGGSAILAYLVASELSHVDFATGTSGEAAHQLEAMLPGFQLEPTFAASIAHLQLVQDAHLS